MVLADGSQSAPDAPQDTAIVAALQVARSWAEASRTLQWPVCGYSYRRLQRVAREREIDVSHMRGQAWRRG